MTDFSMTTFSDSVRQDRVETIQGFGFTERQARFLVLVLAHSGVFLERQYRAFAGIAHGQKTHDFLETLVGRGYAKAITPGALHRGRFYHVQYKPLYQVIGDPDNRNRKPAELGRFVERLMLLDAVLDDPTCTWLGTHHDKRTYFIFRLHGRVPTLRDEYFPRLIFRRDDEESVRCFPDKLPIGVARDSQQHVFVYLVTRSRPDDFRLFLHRHRELLSMLYEWTIRLLVPPQFRPAAGLYRQAIREEYLTPLRPYVVEELEWFFRARQGTTQPSPHPGLTLATAAKNYGSPRFRALRRSWEQHGDGALRDAQSDSLIRRVEVGQGRIEFVALTRQYLQLSHLVGVA
jgi:hypothetical protein